MAAYREALKLEPRNAEAALGIARSYRAGKQWARAVEAYERLAAQHRRLDGQAQLGIAWCYYRSGDSYKAAFYTGLAARAGADVSALRSALGKPVWAADELDELLDQLRSKHAGEQSRAVKGLARARQVRGAASRVRPAATDDGHRRARDDRRRVSRRLGPAAREALPVLDRLIEAGPLPRRRASRDASGRRGSSARCGRRVADDPGQVGPAAGAPASSGLSATRRSYSRRTARFAARRSAGRGKTTESALRSKTPMRGLPSRLRPTAKPYSRPRYRPTARHAIQRVVERLAEQGIEPAVDVQQQLALVEGEEPHVRERRPDARSPAVWARLEGKLREAPLPEAAAGRGADAARVIPEDAVGDGDVHGPVEAQRDRGVRAGAAGCAREVTGQPPGQTALLPALDECLRDRVAGDEAEPVRANVGHEHREDGVSDVGREGQELGRSGDTRRSGEQQRESHSRAESEAHHAGATALSMNEVRRSLQPFAARASASSSVSRSMQHPGREG